jgi:hypothetical protein
MPELLSHALASEVLDTGTHFLWRASASLALAPIEILLDGAAQTIGIPPERVGFPPALAAATDTIGDPRSSVRHRPGRSSPRATKKKASEFPTRQGQPAITRVT